MIYEEVDIMQNAILVGPDLKQDGFIDYYMEELKNLAEARNLDMVYTVTQSLKNVNPATYIGIGKVQEIADFVSNLDVDIVIFNDELSGSQIRNLEEILNCRVIDRTLLILDIFATRAKTKEAMLQVEIAQLDYMKPRLKGLCESLNRQQGGIGSRGPGEKKLELDRRKIEKERTNLENELKKIVKSRQIQRRQRTNSALLKAAIVGYTNAGKSTLMNVLVENYAKTEKHVKAQDMLFATLETATRKISPNSNKNYIITDTVGFVSHLPHGLVEAFKSTLEEITEADFLIHIVDGSNPHHDRQIQITHQTLEDIGVIDIPSIYIYNKKDLIKTPINPHHFPHIIVSLKDEQDITLAQHFIEEQLFKNYQKTSLLIPFKDGDVVSKLNQEAHILSQSYEEDGTYIEVELSQLQRTNYDAYVTKKRIK
ncbi:MAG: GTPase HflX [Candidatus Izimaplasma sp.]|nr:GTPase HflX [Candidatus Izimaplasma bacterium]